VAAARQQAARREGELHHAPRLPVGEALACQTSRELEDELDACLKVVTSLGPGEVGGAVTA
jgi:hypothetical protein